MVARGENSVGALRFVKKLVDNGVAATVLGNHDLTLLAVARGIKEINPKDNTLDVINALESDDLIEWLRHQPLCLFPNEHTSLDACWYSTELDVRTGGCFSERSRS